MSHHGESPFAAGKRVIVQVLVDDNIEPLLELQLPLRAPTEDMLAQIPGIADYALPLLITHGEAKTTFCLCPQCRQDQMAAHALTLLGHILRMAAQMPLRMLDETLTEPPVPLRIVKPS